MATEKVTKGDMVNAGGIVRPIYSDREMRCLIVSESELKQLGLANWGVTICVAIGSALFSFALDLFKDVSLTPPTDSQTEAIIDAVQWLCGGFGIVFYLVAVLLFLWRRDMIKTIKKETPGWSSEGGPTPPQQPPDTEAETPQ